MIARGLNLTLVWLSSITSSLMFPWFFPELCSVYNAIYLGKRFDDDLKRYYLKIQLAIKEKENISSCLRLYYWTYSSYITHLHSISMCMRSMRWIRFMWKVLAVTLINLAQLTHLQVATTSSWKCPLDLALEELSNAWARNEVPLNGTCWMSVSILDY